MRWVLMWIAAVTGWGTGCVNHVRRDVVRATECREYLAKMPDDDAVESCPRADHSLVVVGAGQAMLCRCEGLTVKILQP